MGTKFNECVINIVIHRAIKEQMGFHFLQMLPKTSQKAANRILSARNNANSCSLSLESQRDIHHSGVLEKGRQQ